MTETVLARRFVNTPTVMELWEVEHAKEPQEVDDKEVDELSDEYDTKGDVTGTESYYKWILTGIQEPHRDLKLWSGNESLWDTIKSGFNSFIEQIKKFFKWVFGFFTSKKRIVDQTTEKLEKAIKIKGVKEGDIPYPKDYPLIWNAEGKPGNDIGWIKGKLTLIENSINNEGKAYLKILRDYISGLATLMTDNTQMSATKDKFDDAEKAFVSKLATTIKAGPFVACTVLEIGKNGKLVGKANPKITRAGKAITFKATVNGVESILNAVNHTNKLYGEMTKEVTEMETIFIDRCNQVMRLGTQVDTGDEAKAKAIADRVKQILSVHMANIKLLQNLYFKAINAGLTVANAAVKQDGAADKEEDKK